MVTEVRHRQHLLFDHLGIPPKTVDVSVWWMLARRRGWEGESRWFVTRPEMQEVRFRVLLVRYKKLHSSRVRVDLVYSLTALPTGMHHRSMNQLHKILTEAVETALPGWDVSPWSSKLIDTEVRGRDCV